ncbi:unnamed protein product [Rotaria sp. Silwood2]|nr:unnamed protein product [Rotaria sp. Silwood2]CAF2618254.1 unnamed protein product [Rotaria sp. Silwood2]CAF2854950.1 unnamed protein product [Rotaria sp. Silwood2]CAF3012679.1 unnamed protein product [Rotaria sp. Silwood2]CAF3942866.1 unnamed protein product [Rotaria sp. Silwood2]
MAAPCCNVGPPKHVYSAILKNSSGQDVELEIEYMGSKPDHRETIKINVPKNGSHKIVEKTVQSDGCEQRKVLQKITVQYQNGTKQELKAPFEGVISPQQNWRFEIDHDHILKSCTT